MAASLENYSGGTFLSDLVARPEFLAYKARPRTDRKDKG